MLKLMIHTAELLSRIMSLHWILASTTIFYKFFAKVIENAYFSNIKLICVKYLFTTFFFKLSLTFLNWYYEILYMYT